jgi:2-haloalkanoic acid dehalogenase type II
MTYSHLTFDCYGTLIDWRRGIEEHLGTLLRKGGSPLGKDAFQLYAQLEVQEESGYKPYREVLRDTALNMADHLCVQLTREEAEGFGASVPLWPPFGDSAEVLRELGRRGYKRVILSNVDRDLLEETLARNHVEVDGYITAQDVKGYKPATGHWITFLETYDVARAQVLHVAQSIYHDIVPASGLGLATAWINRYREPMPAGLKQTYTLRDLRGLLKVLA